MTSNKQTRTNQNLNRFRWVIGTPYFVQGTISLTEIPILYFINFKWGVLAVANAGSVYPGGWFQGQPCLWQA